MPATSGLDTPAPTPASGPPTHPGPAPARFAVLGTGPLGAAIAEALTAHGAVDRIDESGLDALDVAASSGTPAPGRADASSSPGYTALVVATEAWDTSGYPRTRRACAEAGLPWLPVRAELGTVIIGPLEQPGTPGCVDCWQTRRHRARQGSEEIDAVWQRNSTTLTTRPSSWLTTLATDTIGAVVAEEMARVADSVSRDTHTRSDKPGEQRPARPVLDAVPDTRTHHAALAVDLERLTVTRHRFLPEPLCPNCGQLPEDTAELAEITLVSRPKPTPHTYRVRPVIEELDTLLDTYVDDQTGLIRALGRATAGGLAVAVAETPLREPGRTELGAGRTRSYRTSELIAMLEAIERWGGLHPGGKRTVVRASYAELDGRALDPRALGVHPAQSYQLPEFRFRPFDQQQACLWTWGYSFARQAPILVPQAYAYYGALYRTSAEDRPFVYEISNGCALGGCLEEAILYGILEVAERDAFLMTWYGRMPVPRLDLDTAADPAIPLQAAAITAETGYHVQVYDTTLEQGIPCVWTMATSPEDGDPNQPRMVCAAGSHLDTERAVVNALSELGPILTDMIARYPQEADQARKMVTDPTLVATMHNHSTLYGTPQAFDRLDFLTTGTDVRNLADIRASRHDMFGHADLTDDLNEALGRYLNSGLDVIVVDQTTDEHRAGGFACVKVLIPGTVPMTFGYHNRRVDGLPRLYNIPHKLGYRSRPLHHDELNPHPHPFP
jgi:ribosomal protein S12 methylthiotransferase accessory factor